jgi:hypothetical protein
MANKTTDDYISGEQYLNLERASTKPKKQITFTSHTIALVAVVIGLCILSFIGGLLYQKHSGSSTKVAASSGQTGTTGALGGTGTRRRNGGLGQVTAVSPTSITITNQRTNASNTYAITTSTTITDSGQTVDTTDIKSGDTVLVTTGTTDTTTATQILVNPSFGGGFGGGGQQGSASPDSSSSNTSN